MPSHKNDELFFGDVPIAISEVVPTSRPVSEVPLPLEFAQRSRHHRELVALAAADAPGRIFANRLKQRGEWWDGDGGRKPPL